MQVRGAVLTGLGLGIGLLYLLDAYHGGDRRARVRHGVARAARLGGSAAAITGREVIRRTSGAATRLRGAVQRKGVDDGTLVERVREQMGFVVSHPHAIDIESAEGIVTLRGPILYAETARLMHALKLVRGLRDVVSELEEHKMTWNVPALQGGSTPPGLPPSMVRRELSPATRLLTGTTGMALAGYGAVRHDAPGALLAAAGMALVARAICRACGKHLSTPNVSV